ncbi:MAG: FAD-binding oxidoreductase, partial [Chromatiales bacterium]|nr:FAD-binding oxidoreductase [Chromatiales bacterium]
MSQTAEAVVIGAGIAGAAAAYFLSVRHGVRNVQIVEVGDPLSLTSDKSTECYRNWWPGPGSAMVDFTNRSIDLLEQLSIETGERFNMNRRGYAFATADAGTAEELRRQAEEAQALGAGPLRVHDGGSGNANYIPHTAEGWQNMPTGTDLLLNPALIAKHFPGISPTTTAVAHVRRCGWIRAQQLGAFFLEQARAHGAKLVRGKVVAITQSNGTVTGVDIETASSQRHVATPTVVLSPGPYLAPVLALLGLHYDITCECHVKIALKDSAAALPASSPLLLWSDPVELPWTDDEREVLGADAQTAYLLRPFPAGVHARPEGSPGQHYALALWTYDIEPSEPAFPIEWDPHLPEIIVRGLTAMLPGMHAYLDPLPRIPVDGG